MSQYVGHLVRRGVQYTSTAIAKGDNGEMPQMPAWGIALLSLSVVAFAVLFAAVGYTLDDVIGTLAMIETPTNAIALAQSEEEADKKDGLIEAASVPIKPVTSKIRTTIKHITAIGGRWARWRAVVPAILYSSALGTVSNVFVTFLPRFIPARLIVGEVLGAVSLCLFHMTWTHAVISMPSPLRWYQRFAPISAMKKLWLPSAVHVIAVYAAIYLTFGFAILIGFCNTAMPAGKSDGKSMPKGWLVLIVVEGIAIVAFAITMALFIVIPASVTLARVEASMLPEDQETIVHFDRSFDGKVIPKTLGGTGVIGFVDAWRTFDWEARRRLVKLYLKNFLIMTALLIVSMHIIGFELWAIMGSDVTKAAANLKAFSVPM